MKRYRFRFQTVLDIKQLKEELKKREFSQILELLRAEEARLSRLRDERRQCQAFFASRLASRVSGLEMAGYKEYLEALRQAIEVTIQKINLFHELLEEKRVELVEASKQKKVFEKLNDRDYSQYRQLVYREDLKFLDEVTMTHYGKSKQKGGET